MTDLEIFERAFDSGVGGCVRTCECSQIFFDNTNGYDWEPGELDRLLANPKARPVDYPVETLNFEGKEVVTDCDCWHKRAKELMAFIDWHADQIAEFLTLRKKEKQRIADAAPVVKE